jgi:hypothetical protein
MYSPRAEIQGHINHNLFHDNFPEAKVRKKTRQVAQLQMEQ